MRISDSDLKMMDEKASRMNMTRTALIKLAVKSYSDIEKLKSIKSNVDGSLKDKAISIIDRTVSDKINISDFYHPFLDKIEKESLAVETDDGKVVLGDLKGLLDFVEEYVFTGNK